MKIFADRLKELRLGRNLTIKQAAKELQISASTLARYELWIIKPNLKILCRILDFYGVTADWLLGR
jgi:transcriptional regulator with XRE-family HTH domain